MLSFLNNFDLQCHAHDSYPIIFVLGTFYINLNSAKCVIISQLGILITLILVVIIALVILGIGWTNLFSAIMKGAEKVKEIPVIRNITDTAQVEFNKILNNVSSNVVNNIGS